MIEHIIVLMYENRSFDHLLGFLDHPNASTQGFNGLAGHEFNPVSIEDQNQVFVTQNASGVLHTDPGHHHYEVMDQLFHGIVDRYADLTQANNLGFLHSFTKKIASEAQDESNLPDPDKIMDCFRHDDPSSNYLKTFRTLALEYAICDKWFCSVPGATWPNRQYIHSGTSDGTVDNKLFFKNEKTIYEVLAQHDKTWRIYLDGPAQSQFYYKLKFTRNGGFRKYNKFVEDVESGNLPNYTFIEPRHFKLLKSYSNDMHPGQNKNNDQDFIGADNLLHEIYTTLRGNPEIWEKTLLVVTFDEHGGFYDHVAPPVSDDYIPDNKTADAFRFNMLGVRVPSLLISPQISKGVIDHTIYDHTSVIATALKLFGIQEHLTNRDKNANTFDHLLSTQKRRELSIHAIPKAIALGVPKRLETQVVKSSTTDSESESEEPRLNDLQADLYKMTKMLREVEGESIEEVERNIKIQNTKMEMVVIKSSQTEPLSESQIIDELLEFDAWFDNSN